MQTSSESKRSYLKIRKGNAARCTGKANHLVQHNSTIKHSHLPLTVINPFPNVRLLRENANRQPFSHYFQMGKIILHYVNPKHPTSFLKRQ
jgi:hypothetical protein